MRSAKTLHLVAVAVLAACGGGSDGNTNGTEPAPVVSAWPDSIEVRHPVSLPPQLPSLRVPVGLAGDYKPNLALLSDGEILLVMFHPQNNPDNSYQDDVILYRSTDAAQMWQAREVLPISGHEPYFTVLADGTLFITSLLLATDRRNTLGYHCALIHRSTDNGHTWDTLPILVGDVPGAVRSKGTRTSRTIAQLADGSLVVGVSSGAVSYTWRSYDEGVTWARSQAATVVGTNPDTDGIHTLYNEMVFYQPGNGDLLGIARTAATGLPPFPGTDYPAAVNDNTDRMALMRSSDGGATWTLEGPVGDYYGEMYPAFLHLADNRLLFTFTDRSLALPLGVEATLGAETSDGFSLNLASDRVLVDEKTPAGQPSGGGFGNTIQAPDGALVTAYSYRDSAGTTHVETARWKLPL